MLDRLEKIKMIAKENNNVISENDLKKEFSEEEIVEISSLLDSENITIITNEEDNYDIKITANLDNSIKLYLTSISKIPILTPEEEKYYAERMKNGDQAAKDKLINSNLRLVVSIAKRYRYDNLPLLDLIQEGNIGLINAVNKFDYTKGYRFSTCASWWIRQAIGKFIDNQVYMIKIPAHIIYAANSIRRASLRLTNELGRQPTLAELAEETNFETKDIIDYLSITNDTLELDEIINHASYDNYNLTDEFTRNTIDTVLNTLKPNEAKVIRERFGLNTQNPKTLREVGEKFNVTKERVRQLEMSALRKMRHPARAQLLAEC